MSDALSKIVDKSEMLALDAAEKALVRTVTYHERDAGGNPVVKVILDPFSPDLDAAIAGCEYALVNNPKIESIELHRLRSVHLGSFSRSPQKDKKVIRKTLSEDKDVHGYRSELMLAIDAHLGEIDEILEKKADEISHVRTYINKALALMQFGIRANLISQDQFEVYYTKLSESKATADAVQAGTFKS